MVRRFVDEELIPIEGKSLDGQKLKPEIEAGLKPIEVAAESN